MIEITEDPTTNIIARSQDSVEYECIDGRRWKITGVCNSCGLCEDYPEVMTDNNTVTYTNIRIVNDVKEIWTRTIIWKDLPGTPYACEEVGYYTRKDIPMTPDGVNRINGCSMQGEWL